MSHDEVHSMSTDEIMALADAFATSHRFRESSVANARATLQTAIDALVEQAKWAHHSPTMLTEADAAADLAGMARPGAEPVAGSLALNAALGYVERHTPHLVYAEIRKALAAPQPAQDERLMAVNAQLLGALKKCADYLDDTATCLSDMAVAASARAAIQAETGETGQAK